MKTMRRGCLFAGVWGLSTFAFGCSPDDGGKDDDEEQVDTSCDGAAAHFREICAEDLGDDFAELNAEMFRVDCIGMAGFMEQEARCAARARSCEALVQNCDISSVTFVCEMDADCEGQLHCSAELEDCVACLEDAHCAQGKSCASGLCLDDGNQYHLLE